jgi:chorismate synthase
MASNSFGNIFRFTTWGESHGEAIGCVVDGVPSLIELSEADIQPFLDKRKPGQNKFTTQRREGDEVKILSGVFEGKTRKDTRFIRVCAQASPCHHLQKTQLLATAHQ